MLVDYTSATAVRDNVLAAIDAGVHVVVGSSGLTADDYVELDRRARRQGVGVFAAGNFSIMAAVLQRAAQLAAQHLDSWEILDYANDTKPDVPSGTARELAETLGQVREPRTAVPLRELHGPVEARGAEVAGSRIHSVRLPSFVVSTEIVFGGQGERLVMRHDPGESPRPLRRGHAVGDPQGRGGTRCATRSGRAPLRPSGRAVSDSWAGGRPGATPASDGCGTRAGGSRSPRSTG